MLQAHPKTAQTLLSPRIPRDSEHERYDPELEEELKKIAGEYKLELDEVKRAIPVEDMKRDLRLRKASELVMAEAKVGEAPKKEEAEEKPKKTTRKSTKTEEKTEE